MSYKDDKLKELDECLFGKLIPRPPGSRVKRMKHDINGWRHRVNCPFEFDGITYDLQPNIDKTVELYDYLRKLIKES